MNVLDKPLTQLPATSVITGKKFASLGLQSYGDLLEYFPSRLEDRSTVAGISSLQEGETVTVIGTIRAFETVFARSRMTIQKAELEDETGRIGATWFNQRYLNTVMTPGIRVALWGDVRKQGGNLQIFPREYEVLKNTTDVTVHMGRAVAVYPERRGLSSKTIRDKMRYILTELEHVSAEELEFLPPRFLETYKLVGMKQAYQDIHAAQDAGGYERARRRLGFNELFIIQLCAHLVRTQWRQRAAGVVLHVAPHQKELDTFISSLPFRLTLSQKSAVQDIFTDLRKPYAMNRFLQGDVGSGKTVVAALACLITHLNGYKSLMMAPTEILALQHYETLKQLFRDGTVKIACKTGTKKLSDTKDAVESADIVVGTHALLNESLDFRKVGFIVIDEQHRFGVRQRALVQKKGINPHLLTMTATPIPRTVALTLMSELDMSVISEMPAGRLAVKSYLVPAAKRQSAYQWIHKQIAAGRQAFIVCPLIDESEKDTLKSVRAASREYDHLARTVFPDLRLGLLHGRLKADEKARIMADFNTGDINILVSTSVVEVGIDIPNASVIVIEGAERFGLAQLHQLRGRVGRASHQSYCLLFTESESSETAQRLTFFATHPRGIDIAQYDLEHRGPGQLYGTQQHGYLDLKIASLADPVFIELVKKSAEEFLATYTLEQFPRLKQYVDEFRIHEIAKD